MGHVKPLYKTDDHGNRRRVRRRPVDVLCRFGRQGDMEPVAVLWPDGRRFDVDEVLWVGPEGGQTLYRVRFGGHETEMRLVRPSAVAGEPERMRWTVDAYTD